MNYFRGLRNQLMFAVLLLSGLFLTSCNTPIVGSLNPPFGCSLKVYAMGTFVSGDLLTGDCTVPNNDTRLIDYYEFTLSEVDTVSISLTQGTPWLYKRDGTPVVICCGDSITRNLIIPR
jgi:hypothetical protein